jgi:hypothetical protein
MTETAKNDLTIKSSDVLAGTISDDVSNVIDTEQVTENSLIISGLSDEQFETLANALTGAIRPNAEERTLYARALQRLVGTAVLMVPVAGSVWLVAYILTNLPGR